MSKWKEHRDEGHRKVGRYMAEFSLLVREMRERIQQRFRRPGDPPLLANLLFAGATAEPITIAFFEMCLLLKEHDTDEGKAAIRLRVLVTKEITLRNDVAHSDWYVGYTSTTGLPDGTASTPESQRGQTGPKQAAKKVPSPRLRKTSMCVRTASRI
jgi:hypothetical protein